MRHLTLRVLGRASVLSALAIAPLALANNSWNGYHWGRSSNPFALSVGNNLTGAWSSALGAPYYGTMLADWSRTTPDKPGTTTPILKLNAATGGATNLRKCGPTAGRVEVCNYRYGYNGWLGIAQVWVSGLHITQGTVKLNDSYFSTVQYNSAAWRQLVICQEVGHTLGLDHQDETFTNTNLGTCMDYTNDPDGSVYKQLNNTHPNQHDYDELVTIYTHLDAVGTIINSPPSAAAGETPAEWGRLMRSTNHGRTQVFEQELGGGHRLVTFVIWAEGHE